MRHLNGSSPIFKVIFGREPSEMLETHKTPIEVVFPFTVRAERYPILSLKAPVACHPCHNESDNLSSSRSPYSIRDKLLGVIYGGAHLPTHT